MEGTSLLWPASECGRRSRRGQNTRGAFVIRPIQARSDRNRFGAESDEAGRAFQYEAGHRFRYEAGWDSDLMSATQRSLPRIKAMMFRSGGLVKRPRIFGCEAGKNGRFVRGRLGGGG
jgi:hypothetical protein